MNTGAVTYFLFVAHKLVGEYPTTRDAWDVIWERAIAAHKQGGNLGAGTFIVAVVWPTIYNTSYEILGITRVFDDLDTVGSLGYNELTIREVMLVGGFIKAAYMSQVSTKIQGESGERQ